MNATRNPYPAILVVAILSTLAISPTFANNIGINFMGQQPPSPVGSSQSAGVVAQTNWNNIATDGHLSGSVGGLVDSAGNFTDVSIDYQGTDNWHNDGPMVTADDKLMFGILKVRLSDGNDTLTMTINNVPAGTYDVYLYTQENADGAFVDSTVVGGSTTYYTISQHQFAGTFIQGLNTVNSDGMRDFANYVKFTGVSPSGGAITVTAVVPIGTNVVQELGIAAIQLVGTGTYGVNTLPLNSITAPDSVSVTIPSSGIGLPVSFTAVADLPANYQWYSNNVAIPGATESTYTTPPTTVADNGTLFHCVASNNVNSVTSADATLTAIAAANLLNNGNLSAGTTIPDGWVMMATLTSNNVEAPYGSGGQLAGFANNGDVDPTGLGFWYQPWRTFTPTPPPFPGTNITVHLYQDHAGTPGQKYLLTGFARAENNYCGLLDGTPTVSEFALDFLDASSNVISSTTTDLGADLLANANAWISNAVAATAPAGTVTVRSRSSMIHGFFNQDPQQSYFADHFTLICLVPVFSSESRLGSTLTLEGGCGMPGAGFSVLASTDVTAPIGSWSVIQSGTFDGGGNFSIAITPISGEQRYFVIRSP